MATTQCPYCGNPVRIGAAFCPNCGHTLPTTQSLIAAPLEAGMLLRNNRYRIEKQLGKGGAGDVYRATDSQLFNRPVVVKRLRVQETDPRDRMEAEQAFQREAQALAGLNNPRFPQVLDFFTDPPMQYLVMEFVAGENLDDRLEKQRQPMSEDQVRDIALQLAPALVDLSRRNPPIIHRDIKPANIIMDNADQVTLVDFGISLAKPPQRDGHGVPQAYEEAWGTPGYAPPEQVAGRAEPKSDIYALGATLHHLLTGRDPREHVGEPFPPAAQVNRAISPAMSSLLARMLDPDPARRPDAPAVLEELRQIDNMVRVAKTTGSLAGALPASSAPPPSAQPVAPPRPGAAPYIFPTGDRATSLDEFTRLADRNWESAREGLYTGQVARWLSSLGDRNMAADAQKVTNAEQDRDLGLETFLQRAAPDLPRPRLAVQPDRLDMGTLRPGQRQRKRLRISNSSRGALRARVYPSDRWISVSPHSVTVRAGTTREVEVNAVGPSGGTRGGSVEVAAGQAGTTQVAVLVQTPGGQAAAPAQGGGASGAVFRLMILLGLGALAIFALQQGWLTALFAALDSPTPEVATPTSVPIPTQPTGPITFGLNDWSQPGYGAGHANFSPVDFGLPDRVVGTIPLTGGDGDALPSVPLVAGRTAFVAFNNALTAYNLDARQPIWSKAPTLPGAIAANESRVIAGSASGLIAYEAENGNVAWQAVIPDITQTDMVVGPGADGATVTLIGKGSRVWAVDAASGNIVLSYGTDVDPQTFSVPAAGPALVYLRDPTGITALNVRPTGDDSALRWQTPMSAEGGAPALGPNTGPAISPPVTGGLHVFVRVRTPERRTELRSLDAGDGSQTWSVEALPGESAPSMDDTRLYVTGEREVAAYDSTTGQELWRQTLQDVGTRGDALLPEPPLVTPRYIYVVSDIGKIFALDPATGAPAGTLTLSNRPLAPTHNPIVANGRMYVVTTDGTLYEVAGR